MYAATPYFIKHLAGQTRVQNILAAIAALAMNSLYPGDKTLPALFLGFCLGYNIMKNRFPFRVQGELGELKERKTAVMFMRCLTGFAGLVVIYVVLRLLLPGEGNLFRDIPMWGRSSPFNELGRFIRYSLAGLWASAGAPLAFQRMGLSYTAKGEGNSGEESKR
jgi:hypothetical protein